MSRDMETVGQHVLDERAMIDGSAFIGLEETKVVKNMKIFDWSPEKDRTEDVVEKVRGTFEAEFEDLDSDSKTWELDVRATPTDTTAAPQYEEENWDKELAESENDHPYDFEDAIHIASFLDQDPATSCSTQERPLYDPSFHHAASLTLNLTQVTPVDGQFDDAVD